MQRRDPQRVPPSLRKFAKANPAPGTVMRRPTLKRDW
jgi:hypothetical protein